jgi:hypothetical protein
MKSGFKGSEEMKRRLADMARQMTGKAPEALAAEAQGTLELAQSLAPVATGELRDSGRIVREDDIANRNEFTAPHAAIVHEDKDAQHDNGQAKFLETAFNEAESGMARRLAQRLDVEKLK